LPVYDAVVIGEGDTGALEEGDGNAGGLWCGRRGERFTGDGCNEGEKGDEAAEAGGLGASTAHGGSE
jgi:hypothetical protein